MTMNKRPDEQVKPPLGQINKLIKRIWYGSFAVGSVGVMLQHKFVFKETFLIITVSTLLLAFSCAMMLINKEYKLAERILYTIATIVLMFVTPHWLDIPSYLSNDYRVVEGVPTQFEYRSPYKAGSYLQVKIQGIELKMPTSIPKSDSHRWFVVHYLPNSKFIMDYKILTK
jgi:hypothetical protein